jgi:hypothetical protein
MEGQGKESKGKERDYWLWDWSTHLAYHIQKAEVNYPESVLIQYMQWQHKNSEPDMQHTCFSKYGNPQNIDLSIHDQECNLSPTHFFNVKTKM